jgi:hypothetical protein
LEDGEGLYCSVEVFGEEVPEDFRPEETFDCGGYLIWWVLVVNGVRVMVREAYKLRLSRL